jgi:hypothetical protein
MGLRAIIIYRRLEFQSKGVGDTKLPEINDRLVLEFAWILWPKTAIALNGHKLLLLSIPANCFCCQSLHLPRPNMPSQVAVAQHAIHADIFVAKMLEL